LLVKNNYANPVVKGIYNSLKKRTEISVNFIELYFEFPENDLRPATSEKLMTKGLKSFLSHSEIVEKVKACFPDLILFDLSSGSNIFHCGIRLKSILSSSFLKFDLADRN